MKKKIIFFLMFVLLITRVIYTIYLYNFKYKNWQNIVIEVKILNVEKIAEDGITYTIKYNKDKFQLYIKNTDKIYQYGDVLRILSSNYEITKYNNPYEFDYKKYLNANCFVSRIYCVKIIEEKERIIDLMSYVHSLRNIISNRLMLAIGDKNANFLKSIIYGDDTFLDDSIKEKFTNIGLAHILCVSGTHIIFLIRAFENITDNKSWKIGKIILLIYFYIISLFNITLLRSLLMFSIGIIKKKASFNIKFYLTLYIVIIINPYYIFNTGVIFSFLSILSINLYNSIINSWLNIKFKGNNKILKFIIDNISLTLSSQVLLIPFQIYFFQKLTLISIISNVVISFFFNMLMLSGFTLFLMFFIPGISNVLIYISNAFVYLVLEVVDILDTINYFNISLPKINILIFILYYVIIFINLYGKKVILISWQRKNTLKRFVKCVNYLCYIVILLWYINVIFLERYVIFFNVGQGNMALIHDRLQNIIVDCGSTREEFAGSVMLNFLKAKNITKIDCIAITHFHNDHINGIIELLQSDIKIEYVILSKICEKNTEYENLTKLLKQKEIAIIEVEEDDEILIGNTKINIIAPPKNFNISDNDILNANSNVYLISTMNKDILFMGDATIETEKYILNKYSNNEYIKDKFKNLDIYQVGHHGSNTSTSKSFISKINSCNAIISADKKVYGHPSEAVIELLESYNFKIKNTQKNGAIIF